MPCCSSCGGDVDRRHRFCPWCAAPLRSKLVELFHGHPEIEGGSRALRVSRYLSAEPSHTRLSVWDTDRAVSAISLDDAEAARLARFLATGSADGADTEPLPACGGG